MHYQWPPKMGLALVPLHIAIAVYYTYCEYCTIGRRGSGPSGNRKSVVCHVPILCSFGDLDTASGCDIGDRKNLEEKPARIVPAELGVSDSFLVEQRYHSEIRASVVDPDLVGGHKLLCLRIQQQLVASFAKSAYGKDKTGPLQPISSLSCSTDARMSCPVMSTSTQLYFGIGSICEIP